MCDSCGCGITSTNEQSTDATVTVLKNLLSENDQQAAHNRSHFDKQRVLCINLMSSPGSGKTALLEATIDACDDLSIAVIEGDLETENDAERIRAKGVSAVQITTGNACHLDANMVHHALHQIDLTQLDVLFIENVGNLVCPASFDLGQHRNVTLLSVTEGDDKPAKYPVMFRASDLVLLSKTDLLPFMDDFSPDNVEQHLKALAKDIPLIPLSAKKQLGFDHWINWLHHQVQQNREAIQGFQSTSHEAHQLAA